MLMKKTIIFLFATLLFSCQQGGGPISQADRDAIQKQVTALEAAFKTSSADGLRAIYGPNIISLPPNAEANSGPDKVIEFHTNPNGPAVVSFSLSSAEIEGSGDVAYSRGTWEYKGKVNDSTEVNDRGKYLAVFKRQADKSWKMSHEMWNSNLPLPGQ